MEIDIAIEMPSDKLMCLYDKEYMEPYEYVLLKGGRGGGKTEELARKLILGSFEHSDGVLCTREIQNSIDDSVYKVLVDWIEKLNLEEFFEIIKNRITNKVSGAWFIFKGMQQGTRRNTIKSLKGVKYVWYEEAQGATKESLEKLDPTIRMEGRKIYFSYNPEEEGDAISAYEGKPNALVIEINYYDNPWLPNVLWDLAENCKRNFPLDYNHIWLGQPKLHGERQTVVPLSMLRQCVDAHLQLGHTSGHSYGGLDLAPGMEERNDKNSFCSRKAAVVTEWFSWRCDDDEEISERVAGRCLRFGVVRLFFDAVGVGGFALKTLKRVFKKMLCDTSPVAFMGGAKVYGGDYPFIKSKNYTISNKDFFKNAKSQQWWNIRLRAENTVKLLRGEDVRDPSYYLSFDSSIPNLDDKLRELSQATYKEDSAGRVLIDKAPGDHEVEVDGKKEKRRSPNDGDSCGYAFVRDFQLRGLRANK